MLHIHKLTIPDNHHDTHWQAHRRLGNLEAREHIGGPEWDTSAEEALAGVHRWQHECRFHYWIAYLSGVPVGTAYVFVNARVNPSTAHVAVYVVPEFRSRGIATEMTAQIKTMVQSERFARLRVSLMTFPPDGEQIVPNTGIGAVPADHPGVRFALRHEFTLEQVERYSRYDLASPLIEPQVALARARSYAGDDYETVTWAGATPEDFVPDLTVLRRHLISDAPSGRLATAVDVWDVNRMREAEKQDLLTEQSWAAALRHRPSGQIVAASYLSRPYSKPSGFIEQKGTVVLPEHRGRRLGMLVKAANLLHVHEAAPDVRSIVTSNAEENRRMLDINEALGFRPFLRVAEFQRLLPTIEGQTGNKIPLLRNA